MWPAFSTWLQYTIWCLQAERNFKVMTAVVRRASQVLLSRAWNQWNQLLRYEKQQKEQVMRYVMKQVLNGKTSAAFRAWVEKVKLFQGKKGFVKKSSRSRCERVGVEGVWCR